MKYVQKTDFKNRLFIILIPVILYWGAQIKEFYPNTPRAIEIAQEYGQPYWLISLKWALFPWGYLFRNINTYFGRYGTIKNS